MILTQNSRLASDIKERFLNVAETSTLHGLSHIVNARTKLKLNLWLAFLLLSTSLLVAMSTKNITEYFSWPVTTNVRFINEKEIEFPGVVICNTNPFVTEQGAKFLVEFARNYTGNFTLGLKETKGLLLEYNVRYTAANLVNFIYSKSAKMKFGLPYENFIINCKFAGAPCHSSNWSWFYIYWNGNCFLFTAGLTKSVNKEYGLSVELFTGLDKTITFFQKSFGFQVFIFNQIKYLKTEYYIPRTAIKPGSEVNIEIKRRFIHKLPRPYSECDIDLRTATIDSVDSQLYREIFLANYSYEQFNCLHRAYRRKVFTDCNCVVELSDVGVEAKMCFTKEEQACRISIEQSLQISKFDGIFDDQCPLECNINELNMKLSTVSFPSFQYGNYLLKNNINFKESKHTHDLVDVRNSVVRVNFYFKKLGHEILEEKESMTLVNLLANMGGILGVFLGMSLLTLIEGLQFMAEIIALLFSNFFAFKL